jgi:hypothetical protein
MIDKRTRLAAWLQGDASKSVPSSTDPLRFPTELG